MKKIQVCLFSLLSCLAVALHCSAGYANDVATQKKEFVDNLAKSALSIVQNKSYDLDTQRQKLINLLVDKIDFKWNAKFVLGSHWKQLDSQKQQEFAGLYKKFLVYSVVPKFTGYNNEKYTMDRVINLSEKDDLVRVMLATSDGKRITTDFRVRTYEGQEFKFIDLIVEGISSAGSYKAQFSEYIAQNGTDAIINFLKTKVAESEKQFKNVKVKD